MIIFPSFTPIPSREESSSCLLALLAILKKPLDRLNTDGILFMGAQADSGKTRPVPGEERRL